MTDFIALIEKIFEQDGPLAESFPGYQPRSAQVKMALSVARALEEKQQLVVEAGTGTGKTFAYLIPALLSGKKIVVSTGTKTLQDQLFYRDLPRISKLLSSDAKRALLKGRANYLCIYRMQQSYEEGRFTSRQRINELMRVREWSFQTKFGDLSECTGIEERSPILPAVTSTAENCLGGECPIYEDCYLVRARKRAQKAQIVVVNHHLFFADQALRGQTDNELIPQADMVIFDEAHQLADIATQFLGQVFSSRQIALFVQDMQVVLSKDAPDDATAHHELEALNALATEMHQAFGGAPRNPFSTIRFKPKLQEAVRKVGAQLKQLAKTAEALAVRSKDLEACWQRIAQIQDRFARLTGETPEGQIHWYELTTRHFRLHLTPLSVADQMQEIYFNAQGELNSAWVFTSATLATSKNDFSLFCSEMGVKSKNLLQLDSPFHYPEQSLCYLPKGLPEPRHPDYVGSLIEQVLPILKLSRGRAFLLFTSYRAMHEAHEILNRRGHFQLFVQGSMAKAQLLELFCDTPNAVLLGTSSFWEGVDVRGDALSVVVIDKLPFSVPDEPVIKARVDAMRKAGKDPFREYQLPQAVLTLKQGAGRLIRDVTDRGVLVLCDPRLRTAHYGQTFLSSLPPMPLTDRFEAVSAFFAQSVQEA